MIRIATLIAAVCVCAVATQQIVEISEQDRVLNLSKGDPAVLAEMLLSRAELERHACGAEATANETDSDRLATAITVVESFATTRFHRTAESLVIHTAVWLGIAVPDLSIGEGQIRVSTAERALQTYDARVPSDIGERRKIALRLLDPCGGHRLGVLVLKLLATERGVATTALDHKKIVMLAAAYNGQSPARSPYDMVPNQTYNEVVYNLFLALCFQAIRTNPRKTSGN